MSSYAPIMPGIKSGTARSKRVSMERIRNLYPEPVPQGGKGQVTLYPTPGLKLWSAIGDGPIRGKIRMGNDLYVVSGGSLYVSDATKTWTELGPIDGVGAVHLIHNSVHVGIAGPDSTYAANRSGITLVKATKMNGAAYQDGYGIFTEANSQKWWITGVDDMTTIGGLDFTSADALTGNTRGVISDHREVWAFMEEFSEVYQNTGNPSFPFDRVTMVERGCRSAASVAKAENTIFWLADDLTVRAASGYQPVPISTTQIEELISEATDPGSARGFVYHQAGHTFYVLSFYDLTVVYDTHTQLWHERVSDGMDRWRVWTHQAFDGKELVGDVTNGNIYELDLDTYDENGADLVREVRFQPIAANEGSVVFDEFHVDFDHGVGLQNGQGSDPQAMLDWTQNGGHNWGNELWADIGKIGEYGRRAVWNRLGASRERTFRLRVSDAINCVIKGAYMRALGVDR